MNDTGGPTATLAYASGRDMQFGTAAHPVTCRNGITIGGGVVLPEVNFALPPMALAREQLPTVRERFRDIVRRILTRAVALHQSALVLEFEQLYELTWEPDWGALVLSRQEARWWPRIRDAARNLPSDAASLRSRLGPDYERLWRPEEYALAS